MAQQTRDQIIAQAKVWAARKGQDIDSDVLISAFDFITRNMSEEYSILPTIGSGTVVADQNYITIPSDYKEPRLIETDEGLTSLKIDETWIGYVSRPAEFYSYDLTEYGTPTEYTIDQAPSIAKILLHPYYETDTPAYEFHYFKYHPKSWISWGGLDAKTDISFTASTKTIAQVAAGFDTEACAAGRKLTVAGSLSNDGTYTIVSVTAGAVIVAEALTDEAAGETITITVESGGNYLHEYGEQWDEVVAHGVAWRAAKIVREKTIAAEELGFYTTQLRSMAGLLTKPGTPGSVEGYYY